MDNFMNTLHSNPSLMTTNGNDHHNVQQPLSPDDVSPDFNTAF